MTMSRSVAEWIAARPDRCATRAELKAQWGDDQRLDSAICSGARNGWIQFTGGVWRRTDAQMLKQGQRRDSIRHDPEGYDQEYELRLADERFARMIGDARYEDVANIGPRIAWRSLPPAPSNAIGCSAALLVGERLR